MADWACGFATSGINDRADHTAFRQCGAFHQAMIFLHMIIIKPRDAPSIPGAEVAEYAGHE
ncbi:hypothetical protein [Sedimenticola selenatireducens]|uniref:hypothetical protein n=1 Tax=Sedimenticola selenatireducens TaxID=191960 RepID=UPI0004B3B129